MALAYVLVYIYICRYIYIYVYMAASQKHRFVTGLGGLFAARLVTKSGGLATKPPCDSLLKTTVLYTEARENRGPATKVCNRGGDRDKPLFLDTATYIYTYIYTYISPQLIYHLRLLQPNLTVAAVNS